MYDNCKHSIRGNECGSVEAIVERRGVEGMDPVQMIDPGGIRSKFPMYAITKSIIELPEFLKSFHKTFGTSYS